MKPLLFALALLLLPAPALAQDWEQYANARFGFAIDVPPGFVGKGEADNGDGQVFTSADGSLILRAYGGFATDGFAPTLRAGLGYAREAGWTLTYTRVTDTWAVYSGTRDDRILYARAIPVCGGAAFASYELDYPVADKDAMDPVIGRLNDALTETDGIC
jgi:hypothetical protein